MAEIIQLRGGEAVLWNRDHVLIRGANGNFVVTGTVSGARGRRVFRPSPFKFMEDALIASSRWADDNNVLLIYIAEEALTELTLVSV